ncbi:MAG: hypothetical protein ACE5HO_09955 [bacterium]
MRLFAFTGHRESPQQPIDGVIKINFLEDKVQLDKHNRREHFLFLTYCATLVISCFFMILNYQKIHILKSVYSEDRKRLEQKIRKVMPQYQTALALSKKRKVQREKLSHLFDGAWEPSILLATLENLALSTPKNVWVKEVSLTTIRAPASKKNEKVTTRPVNSMKIQGKLFFALKNNNGQIQEFQKALTKYRPFSLAQSRLDLNSMRVGKLGDKYFHEFSLIFLWTSKLL